MEADYLVRRCGAPPGRIEIAAPALPTSYIDRSKQRAFQLNIFRPNILFISEALEGSGVRSEEVYRDILPPLADLALRTGRKLIVKLHPAESKSERIVMVQRMLFSQQRSVVKIVSGLLTEDLLATAWFGITILSTVAVECAMRRIHAFSAVGWNPHPTAMLSNLCASESESASTVQVKSREFRKLSAAASGERRRE